MRTVTAYELSLIWIRAKCCMKRYWLSDKIEKIRLTPIKISPLKQNKVQEFSSTGGSVSLRVDKTDMYLVEKKYVGLVIGKAGETVKKIKV